MTADLNTINRIKKLLAVAQAGSGATENEASTAMEFASALMLKHNIDVQLDGEDEDGAITGQWNESYNEPWHIQCAVAVGYLYSCRPLFKRRAGWIQFIGRSDNIQACESTLTFLTNEVERLYKVNLPRGMSKQARANYRSTFKMACAMRLAYRAWNIMESLRRDDLKAIEATGSRALVIVKSIDEQLAEADAILKAMGIKEAIVRSPKQGLGTVHGREAGDSVQLQKQVE